MLRWHFLILAYNYRTSIGLDQIATSSIQCISFSKLMTLYCTAKWWSSSSEDSMKPFWMHISTTKERWFRKWTQRMINKTVQNAYFSRSWRTGVFWVILAYLIRQKPATCSWSSEKNVRCLAQKERSFALNHRKKRLNQCMKNIEIKSSYVDLTLEDIKTH